LKICLTGGNSRLAEAFIALAASHPHIRLRVLGRAHSSLTKANIEWVRGDLDDATVCQKLVSDQDVLVHLAWRGAPLAAGSFARGLREGLLPTARLLDAVAAHGQLRVIYASSGGTVYEDRTERCAYSEDAPCLP